MATRRLARTQHARHIARRPGAARHHRRPVAARAGIFRAVAKRRPLPLLGATMAGGAGLAIASIVGAGELIIGATAAYVTYRIFQRNR